MRLSDKISVIIPTHGDRDLSMTIDSLKGSTYDNLEVVIVKENKERSAQRNIGAAKATGDFFLFLDSDMTVHPKLIEDCYIKCEKNVMRFDAVYIPEVIVGHPIKTFFRGFYNGTRIDAIRFIRKNKFLLFDETLTGVEDWDWDRRTDYNCWKTMAEYPLYHHTKSHLSRKLFYYSKWLRAYKERYPNCPELSLKYRLWTVFIENGKWKKFLRKEKK